MVVDLLEVVTTSRQNRIETVAGYPFEEVSSHSMMLFDMGEDGFDGGASSEFLVLFLVGRSFKKNGGVSFVPMTTVTPVTQEGFNLFADQTLEACIGLCEDFGESVAPS